MATAEKTQTRRYHVVTISTGNYGEISVNDFDNSVVRYSALENSKLRQIEAFTEYLAQMRQNIREGRTIPEAPQQEPPPRLFQRFEPVFMREGIRLRDRQIRHSYQDVLFSSEETGLPFNVELDLYFEAGKPVYDFRSGVIDLMEISSTVPRTRPRWFT